MFTVDCITLVWLKLAVIYTISSFSVLIALFHTHPWYVRCQVGYIRACQKSLHVGTRHGFFTQLLNSPFSTELLVCLIFCCTHIFLHTIVDLLRLSSGKSSSHWVDVVYHNHCGEMLRVKGLKGFKQMLAKKRDAASVMMQLLLKHSETNSLVHEKGSLLWFLTWFLSNLFCVVNLWARPCFIIALSSR